MLRVATDIGGTFTDVVYIRNNSIHQAKCDTVYPHFEQGVINALVKTNLTCSDIDFFAHGTTIVINTLTERTGAVTGLITTRGFRDVLEIARGDTPDIYNVYYQKPKPFVPRYLRCEITERVNHKGEIITPLAENEIEPIIDQFQAEGVTAIAICFLHSYANPEHERTAMALIKKKWPTVAVVTSYQVCREQREYERTNTAALSAYVLPQTDAYIEKLVSKLSKRGLRCTPYIMQSNGGITTAAHARTHPIALIESGPVGGILGAASYAKLIGVPDIIALDIGGTTAKCALIQDGHIPITTEYVIEKTPTSSGYPIKTPVIDLVEIGNGGGSIAWIDSAHALHVGPHSAGSNPGPVAYGRGGEKPTTTDANLYTGCINADNFVGGTVRPDRERIEQAFQSLGDQLGVSAMEAAQGVIQIANANMVNALKLVSVNRGYDPRDFVLIAFGGGGAMHATALASELSIPKVIIPPHAGVFSAWGMLMLDLRRDYILAMQAQLTPANLPVLAQHYQQLTHEARDDFKRDGFSDHQIRDERYIDARYIGQGHTVRIAVNTGEINDGWLTQSIATFHSEHEKAFTFRLDSIIEVVNIHLVSFGLVDKSECPEIARVTSAQATPFSERRVDFAQYGVYSTSIYKRTDLSPGMVINGPAIIEEETTTTAVLPHNQLELDRFGGLHISINSPDITN